MSFLDFESQYDKYPETKVEGFAEEAFAGWEDIYHGLKNRMSQKNILTIECYPGVYEEEIEREIVEKWNPELVVLVPHSYQMGISLCMRIGQDGKFS